MKRHGFLSRILLGIKKIFSRSSGKKVLSNDISLNQTNATLEEVDVVIEEILDTKIIESTLPVLNEIKSSLTARGLSKAQRREIERRINKAIEKANRRVKELSLISPQLSDLQCIVDSLKLSAKLPSPNTLARQNLDFSTIEDSYKRLLEVDLGTVVHKENIEDEIPTAFEEAVKDLVTEALSADTLVTPAPSLEEESNQISELPLLKVDFKEIRIYLTSKNIKNLYHVTDYRNVQSIEDLGLFSWYYCLQNDVQNYNLIIGEDSRRMDMAKGYEDYVRLSFCNGMPMFWRKKDIGIPHFIYKIDPSVCEWQSTIFTDMNALDNLHKNGMDINFLKSIKLEYTQVPVYHFPQGAIERKFHQAEVLVKTHIPPEFILSKQRLF